MGGFFASLFGRKDGDRGYKVAPVYRTLRRNLFAQDPAALGLRAGDESRVWGVVMETGFPEAVASLVAIADGTVSLYFSNGGGMIGVGEHPGPRRAGEALIAAAKAFLGRSVPARAFPLPSKGRVRFYWLTFGGARTAEAGEGELGDGRSVLSPLFHKAHEVITQARLVDGKLKEAADLRRRLGAAAANGDAEAIRRLLASGADTEAADPSGLTALMAASFRGHPSAVAALLDAGAKTEAKDASGYTALMFACNAGKTDCAKLLVEGKAAVEAADRDGSTPIMFAAQHGHNDIVRLLLEKGADPAREGKHGLSALAFARQNGLAETEGILLRKG